MPVRKKRKIETSEKPGDEPSEKPTLSDLLSDESTDDDDDDFVDVAPGRRARKQTRSTNSSEESDSKAESGEDTELGDTEIPVERGLANINYEEMTENGKAYADKLMERMKRMNDVKRTLKNDAEFCVSYAKAESDAAGFATPAGDKRKEIIARAAAKRKAAVSERKKRVFEGNTSRRGEVDEGGDEMEMLSVDLMENEDAEMEKRKKNLFSEFATTEVVESNEDARVDEERRKQRAIEQYQERYDRLLEEAEEKRESFEGTDDYELLIGSLAPTTVLQTINRIKYVIMYAAVHPMELKDFKDENIQGFMKFLLSRKSTSGVPDRIGTNLDISSVTGILKSTVTALRIYGYLPIDTCMENLVTPERAAMLRSYMERNVGYQPILRYFILPDDVKFYINNRKATCHQEHQEGAFLLLKSVGGFRRGSMLVGQCNMYPGIRMKDVEFAIETSKDGVDRMVVYITIKHDKAMKESGSKNYKGERKKFVAIDDEWACVAKLIYTQCLLLNAFVDDHETMVEQRKFRMRSEVLETTLFRATDCYGQFTVAPLIKDDDIMEQFAKWLGLPTYCVTGHSLRYGHAIMLAEQSIRERGGIDSTAIRGNILSGGAWKKNAFWRYIKVALSNRKNLAKAMRGKDTDNGESDLFDVVGDREALFGLPKENYLTSKSPIVIDAVDSNEELKQAKMTMEKCEEEYVAIRARLELSDGGVRAKGLSGKLAKLNKQQRLEHDTARHNLVISRRKHGHKRDALLENFASFGNQCQLESNRLENKEKYRRSRKDDGFLIEFDLWCTAVEHYRKRESKWMYGPFGLPPTSTETKLRCVVQSCGDVFGEVSDLLAHLFSAHGLKPCKKVGGMTEGVNAVDKHPKENAAKVKYVCSEKNHGSNYRGDYSSAADIFKHFRKAHNLSKQCRVCTNRVYGGCPRCTECHNERFVPVEAPYPDITKYIRKPCLKCGGDLKIGQNSYGCVAKDTRVREILKDVPAYAKAAQKCLREKHGVSSQELPLSQGTLAACRLCDELEIPETDEPAIDRLRAKCACVVEEIENRKAAGWK